MNEEHEFSMVENIKSIRSADLVIKVALLGNAILTFMFAYNYLPGLFDLFGLMKAGDANAQIVRFIAGFFATIFFDGAYYAWGQIRGRQGNSSAQMATADSAKKWSLYGSLAASAGQFVLSQIAVGLSDTIVFTVSLVAMIAVAAIALMHMYWYDKHQNESFEAMERTKIATDTADRIAQERKRRKELEALERAQEEHLHQSTVQQLKAQFELEKEKLQGESDLQRQLVMQELNHQRAVAKQTAELLDKEVNKSAHEIAQRKAQQARDNFLVQQGMDPNNFRNGA